MKFKHFLLTILLFGIYLCQAQVGIGTTTPDPNAILDISSTSMGILIPRMTTIQRDAIPTTTEGMQIFNTTSKSLDLFRNGAWNAFENSSLIYIYSIEDLPTPSGSAITLDNIKTYIFSGNVDIGTNYINMNGAGVRGFDPQRDKITSSVAGAVLRSTDNTVLIKELTVAPASSGTQAYNFTDDGTHDCTITASSVNETVTSLGIGEISGFDDVLVNQNFWKATDGLKVGGTIESFIFGFNTISGISAGAGIELLGDLVADDVGLSNNYFKFSGQTGLKVNAAASIDDGRLTANFFRDVTTPLVGITASEINWEMFQNTDIPNSEAVCYIYGQNNTIETLITVQDTFTKIAGTTISHVEKRFTATNNRITYNGTKTISGKINCVIAAISPGNGSKYTLAIGLNGTVNTAISPVTSLGDLSNNDAFQLALNSEMELSTGDYIEVFINSKNDTNNIIVGELQFNVTN